MSILPIVLILIAVIILIVVIIYNSFIAKLNQVKNIYSSVDVYLKRRYDLIPNLVASASKIMEHEKDLFSEITRLRTMCGDAKNDSDKFALNNELSRFLGSIKVALENYPQIKSNENILSLQHSLDDIERQISAARRAYNSAVMVYNNACEMFPTNIIANLFNFQKREFFEADEVEKSNINVKELFK